MHQLIECAVFNYPDERMGGMRFYRIEYFGHGESCAYEGAIWLPAWIDPEKIETILNGKD